MSSESDLIERKDEYLRIGDIVKRFKDIDAYYKHESWNLEQIFANLNILCSKENIIRCKDCRFYRNLGKNSYCTKRLNVDSVIDRYRAPDFYCADAELREDKK